MERIRAKQEKYHQERLPGGEGQDGARAGESRWGGPQPLQPPSVTRAVASTCHQLLPQRPHPLLCKDRCSPAERTAVEPPPHTPMPCTGVGAPMVAPLSPHCRSTAPSSPADPARQRERWWRPWLDHAAGIAPRGARAARGATEGSDGDGAFGEVTPCMPPIPALGINRGVLCLCALTGRAVGAPAGLGAGGTPLWGHRTVWH